MKHVRRLLLIIYLVIPATSEYAIAQYIPSDSAFTRDHFFTLGLGFVGLDKPRFENSSGMANPWRPNYGFGFNGNFGYSYQLSKCIFLSSGLEMSLLPVNNIYDLYADEYSILQGFSYKDLGSKDYSVFRFQIPLTLSKYIKINRKLFLKPSLGINLSKYYSNSWGIVEYAVVFTPDTANIPFLNFSFEAKTSLINYNAGLGLSWMLRNYHFRQ